MIINIAEDGAALGVVLVFAFSAAPSASQDSSLVKNLKVEGRLRTFSDDGGPPSSPSRSSAGSNVALRAARERECARALPRSDFWVLSFGKSESLKGNYTRKATDNGVGGDRAVFRRGREASSSCIAPLLFYKKGRNSSQRGRRGGRPRDRKARWTGTRERGKRKNNEL